MAVRCAHWLRWGIAAAAGFMLVTAQAQQARPPEPAASAAVNPKMGPLLALVVQPLIAQAGKVLAERMKDPMSDGIGSLFDRVMGHRKTTDTVGGVTFPGSGPATAEASALVPSLVYTIDRLDPSGFTTQGQLDMGAGQIPSLKTGDVFALRFATNVPGQVRIDNIDAQGMRSPLGTYNVLPGRDNRVPRTKGIQLSGSTGLETFAVYFYPCLPAEASGLRGYGTYKDSLPACSSGAPGSQLLLASKGQIRTRGAQNLELNDPSMVVSAALDFRPQEVIEQRFRLNHEPR